MPLPDNLFVLLPELGFTHAFDSKLDGDVVGELDVWQWFHETVWHLRDDAVNALAGEAVCDVGGHLPEEVIDVCAGILVLEVGLAPEANFGAFFAAAPVEGVLWHDAIVVFGCNAMPALDASFG